MNPQLECVLCEGLFSEQDILNSNFFAQTRVCYRCYRKMQKAPYSISCFGKYDMGSNLGFSSLAEECRLHCPDRKICPGFANKHLIYLHKQNKQQVEAPKQEVIVTRKFPFKPNTLIDKAFKLCLSGIPKDKFKRWCTRQGTSYYRLTRALKKETKFGKKWEFSDDGKQFQITYVIR